MIMAIVQEDGQNKEKYQQCLFYFILQSLARLIFLYAIINRSMIWIDIKIYLFIATIVVKGGIFPTYFWMFTLAKYIRTINLSIILTAQKLPVVLIILHSELLGRIIEILLLTALTGIIIIWERKSIKNFIVSSSIYSLAWLIIISKVSIQMAALYLLASMVINTQLLNKWEKDEPNLKINLNNLNVLSSIIFIVGLPPIRLFYMKFFSMTAMISIIRDLQILMFWLLTMVATMCYFKFFYKRFNIEKNLYIEKAKIIKKITTLFLISSILIFVF